jgi:hypothetical protein
MTLQVAFLNFIPQDVSEVTPLHLSSSLNKITDSEVKIRCLRDIYTSLYDFSQLISSIYDVFLLGIVVWLFTYSIACVVFALRHISNGGYPVAIIMLFFVSLCLLAAITIPCH